jgi:hypothetical protein
MYPFLLADREYPVRRMSYEEGQPIQMVRMLLNNYAVIASVQMAARVGEYPCRSGDRITYPTGTFDTVLCGDELRDAIDRDEVVRVYRHAAYHRGRPFAEMANTLLEMRAAARANDSPAWELFVKSLSNTFGGKLAQRRGLWERRPNVMPEVDWGEFHSLTMAGRDKARTYHRYRALAGLVWEYIQDKQLSRLLGSAFAYLTMYGRRMMLCLRSMCPTQSIVSQDTDGLWVLEKGYQALPVHDPTTDTPPGHLRLVAQSQRGQWYSPKHYWTDRGWTLAGFHGPARVSDGLSFVDTWTRNDVLTSPDVPPTTVEVVERHVNLQCLNVGGQVDQLGWVHPHQRVR